MKKPTVAALWKSADESGVGSVAVPYAAGEDVILDAQFVSYECDVNMAHVCMLLKEECISGAVGAKLLAGLIRIQRADAKGQYALDPQLEDVHSNIEQTLIHRYGESVGGYLRLGIARNDQVYTDTRMWMRDHILSLCSQLLLLVSDINKTAASHTKTVMPGYTHLRISQPITYGHWLTAKAYHFLDDVKNILNIFDLVNECPLGIFEMAGTHLSIDRHYTAELLGFSGATPHSLYTANQRGELEMKLLHELSLLALHIGRSMGEFIMYSGHEFGLVTLGPAYVTGGTAQPNLLNPDTLEIVRANMAHMHAASVETTMIMDSLPSGFNRDTQVTKKILFESVALMEKTIPVVTGIFTTCTPDAKRMEALANVNFATAPDMAIQISQCGGISFREAYRLVKVMIKKPGVTSFASVTPELIAETATSLLGKPVTMTQAQINAVSTARASVYAHTSFGGPAPAQVKRMIKKIKKDIAIRTAVLLQKKQKIADSRKLLVSAVKKYMAAPDRL